MLPTTYPGAATIDGERIEAELYLGETEAILRVPPDGELARWALARIEIDPIGKGEYRLRHGAEELLFEPATDDGLSDEIGLRKRFQKPTSPATEAVATATLGGGTIAERVSTAGLTTPRRGFRFGRRTLIFGAVGVFMVVALFGMLTVLGERGEADTPVDVGSDDAITADGGTVPPTVAGVTITAPTPTTVPVTTVPSPTVPPTTVPATTVPPTTVPATTAPPETTPTTTVPIPASVFEAGPDALIARWDALARPHSTFLVASDIASGDDHFAFNAGPFVRIEGTAKGGTVDRITFLGDPSGTVADDRKVLTALGLTIAMAEPELLPSGRKELLAALGLDIEEPDLAGLDGSLNYRDHRYTLRWDPEIARIVFTVGPIPES